MPTTEHGKGIVLAISAYVLWGIAPIYFKLLESVSPTEILLHRIIWSFVFVALLIGFTTGYGRIRQLLKHPKKVMLLTVTSVLIAGNWLLFIWAVNNDHILDASLGYYINPLFNIVMAMLFLGERLRKLQWVAVILAFVGVMIQVISFGSLPIISLTLAISFCLYGLLRKKINVDASTGLLVETALLLPFTLAFLFYQLHIGESQFFMHSLSLSALLLLAGVVTSVPLLCFAGAAIRIPFSLLGFFQYIGPSLMFLLAITFYDEPFDIEKAITFGFIWVALIIFSLDGVIRAKKSPK
ncbi:MAG: EamA family transporter RarD [Parashewanella sp.]